ncbi:MAG: CHAT domain-containing protein [Chloroflexi bacterium]|nr:CHAT domain-containing protein [Chloroflexota bacterium]
MFKTLFDDAHERDFSLTHSTEKNRKIILLQLRIDEQALPKLAAYPWEFMRIPTKPGNSIIWVAVDEGIAFSRRRIYVFGQKPITRENKQALRVALVVSLPKPTGEDKLGPIAYDEVLNSLRTLDGEGKIKLLGVVGIAGIQAKPDKINEINRLKPDIWHFIGHGRLVPKKDEKGNDIEVGEIALVDEIDESPFWVDADYVCNILSRRTGLVILQACESGALSQKHPFVGVAATISQQNVPAVVAMQYEVSNSTAKRFIEGFYKSFIEDYYVDRAVQRGRHQITLGPTRFNKRDFATPVVFLSVDNGKVFHFEELPSSQSLSSPQQLPKPIIPREDDFSQIDMTGRFPNVHYVERRNLFRELESRILGTSSVIVLSGPGGNGKTTLARELCKSQRTKEHFTGGILWIELDQRADSVLDGLKILISQLKGQEIKDVTEDIEKAPNTLADLWLSTRLKDRRVLLFIDNAQDENQIRPFLRGGENVVRLVTTRNRTLANRLHNADEISIDQMENKEAEDLLCLGLDRRQIDKNRAGIQDLVNQLEYWPLAIEILNRVLKDRVNVYKQPLTDTLENVRTQINAAGLISVDRDHIISTSIEVSLDWLGAKKFKQKPEERFKELAVFPKNADVPLETLQKLWHTTGGLEASDIDNVCQTLFESSLIVELNFGQKHIRLHDVVQDYLVQNIGSPKNLHAQFLNSFGEQDWSNIPVDDRYLWKHLFHHLKEANHNEEIIATATNLQYLATKILRAGALAVEADLNVAKEIAANESEFLQQRKLLEYLTQGISQYGHILASCNRPEDVLATLYSRFPDDMRKSWSNLQVPYLSPWHPLPDISHPALIRTFQTERFPDLVDVDSGMYCAINSNGEVVVAAARYGDVVVWDATLGIEKHSFNLNEDVSIPKGDIGANPLINDCAINDAGDLIIIAYGNVLILKDNNSGKTRQVLLPQAGVVNACNFISGGHLIVTIAGETCIKTWQLNEDSGHFEEKKSVKLPEINVKSCAVSPDGKFVLLGLINSLKLFDSNDLTEKDTFWGQKEKEDEDILFLDCCLSNNARNVVAVLSDGTIKTWQWDESIISHESFQGHEDAVLSCALNRDGTKLVSTSRDTRVKIWDLEQLGEGVVYEGHTDSVNKCAISDNGLIASVSGGGERRTKLWRSDINEIPVHGTKQERIRANNCVINADRKFVAVATHRGSVTILDTQTGDKLFSLGKSDDPIKGCTISHDGEFIISASFDRRLQTWNIGARTGGNTYFHDGPTNACMLSNDNSFMVSASSDRTLRIWAVSKDGQGQVTLTESIPPLKGHEGAVNSCFISPDDTFIVSASQDKRLGIWESKTGNHVKWLIGHEGVVYACTVGKNFIASASADKTLKIWDAKSYKLRKTLGGEHKERVNGCAFSHDERLLASVSSDRTLRVWQVDSGECLCAIAVDGALYDCKWFLDNESIVAVGSGGTYFFRFNEQ